MVEIKNVHQSFRDGFWMQQKEVLRGIDLTVPDQAVFGFLGPNGSGKTTLIHLMVGLRKPKSGSIRIGQDESTTIVARKKIGYLPERPYFPEHLTGNRFLNYLGKLSGMTSQQLKQRIPEVLKTVRLQEAGNLELRKFSKGMLQRIGIAQAILHEPELLVLDEPMSGLDPLGRKQVRELILELKKQGHTVFFSTHVISDAEAICDSVAIIRDGKVISTRMTGDLESYFEEKHE